MRKKKKTAFAKGEVTFLASGVHIKGDIRFSGNLEIEGQVTGNIQVVDGEDAMVRIAPDGIVNGDIRASHIVVSGKVEGALYSSGQIELADGALVNGDLHYQLLEIEKGAVVNGSFLRDQQQQESVEQGNPASGAINAIT